MSRSTPEFRAAYRELLEELQERQRRGEDLDEKINIYARKEVLEIHVAQQMGLPVQEARDGWEDISDVAELVQREVTKTFGPSAFTIEEWRAWPPGAHGSGNAAVQRVAPLVTLADRCSSLTHPARLSAPHGFNEVTFRREMGRPWRRA